MTDDITEFLNVGLQKYPEARAAVDAFVEAVQGKLRSVFHALPAGEWKFVGAAGLSKGADILSVWQEIQLPHQRQAGLGAVLWWDWKLTPHKCVYYAGIFYSNDIPLPFDYVSKVEGVLREKDKDGAYLYRPATSVETLESDLKVLIEARLAQPNRAKG